MRSTVYTVVWMPFVALINVGTMHTTIKNTPASRYVGGRMSIVLAISYLLQSLHISSSHIFNCSARFRNRLRYLLQPLMVSYTEIVSVGYY